MKLFSKREKSILKTSLAIVPYQLRGDQEEQQSKRTKKRNHCHEENFMKVKKRRSKG
jgi:hypothetical protein